MKLTFMLKKTEIGNVIRRSKQEANENKDSTIFHSDGRSEKIKRHKLK